MPGTGGAGGARGSRRRILSELRAPAASDIVVTQNKIERYKLEKDGLDIVR